MSNKTNQTETKKENFMSEQKCIAIVNYVSCGKTALTRQMFQPAMDAAIVSIETINADQNQAAAGAMSAEKFRAAMAKIEEYMDIEDKSVIVDVGVSNVEMFLKKLQDEKAFGDFDFFFVPITPDARGLHDSIKCISELDSIYGIPPEKIRVIFNKMTPREDVKAIFAPIFNYHQNEGKKFTLLPEAVVYACDAFTMIGSGDLRKAATSTVDLRAAMREAKSKKEIDAISSARAVRRMAPDLVAELEKVAKILLAK